MLILMYPNLNNLVTQMMALNAPDILILEMKLKKKRKDKIEEKINPKMKMILIQILNQIHL